VHVVNTSPELHVSPQRPRISESIGREDSALLKRWKVINKRAVKHTMRANQSLDRIIKYLVIRWVAHWIIELSSCYMYVYAKLLFNRCSKIPTIESFSKFPCRAVQRGSPLIQQHFPTGLVIHCYVGTGGSLHSDEKCPRTACRRLEIHSYQQWSMWNAGSWIAP